jgi:hypothetical protein
MLEGTLAEFSLPSLVQTLSGSRSSGRLEVQHWRGGSIDLASGQVVAAEAMGREGRAALSLLVSIDQAPFRFDPSVSVRGQLLGPTPNLIVQMAADSEEWARLLRRLPTWDQNLELNQSWIQSASSLVSRKEWEILQASQGRSLQALLADPHYPPLDAAKVVADFLGIQALILRRQSKIG